MKAAAKIVSDRSAAPTARKLFRSLKLY